MSTDPVETPEVDDDLVSKSPQTFKEDRQGEAIQRLQGHALTQQQRIQELQKILTRIGDDLVAAGNDPEQIRGYWPDYESPGERGE